MKKLLLSITAMAGLVAASVTFASGAPAPMMSQASNFTGAYLGLDMGFRTADLNLTSTNIVPHFSETRKDSNNHNQSTQGLHVGYGYQFSNNVYLGGKAFAQIAQGSHKYSMDLNGDQYTRETALKNVYGINAELGCVLGERFLPYVTAGTEWLNISDKLSSTEASDLGVRMNNTQFGWDAGVGIHYKATEHFLLNAEYTGAWFSKASKSATANGYTDTIKLQPNVYTGLVGFSYLF